MPADHSTPEGRRCPEFRCSDCGTDIPVGWTVAAEGVMCNTPGCRGVLRRVSPTPAPVGGVPMVWRDCSPEMLASGVDCASTPRRPGLTPDVSHQHLVPVATPTSAEGGEGCPSGLPALPAADFVSEADSFRCPECDERHATSTLAATGGREAVWSLDRLHELKSEPRPFARLLSPGPGLHEVRRNDRDFRAGDAVRFREWISTRNHEGYGPGGEYTGREVWYRIADLTPGGSWGLPRNLCVLGLEPLDTRLLAGPDDVLTEATGQRDKLHDAWHASQANLRASRRENATLRRQLAEAEEWRDKFCEQSQRACAEAEAQEERATTAERRLEEASRSWRCFFCDEVFTDKSAARRHFDPSGVGGARSNAQCLRDACDAQIRAVQQQLTASQQEVARLTEELRAKAVAHERTYQAWESERAEKDRTIARLREALEKEVRARDFQWDLRKKAQRELDRYREARLALHDGIQLVLATMESAATAGGVTPLLVSLHEILAKAERKDVEALSSPHQSTGQGGAT